MVYYESLYKSGHWKVNMNTLELLYQSYPLLMQGMFKTLQFWLVSSVIALLLGSFWGIVQVERLSIVGLSQFCFLITIVLRGTPLYVQLLITYFVLPNLIGVEIAAEAIGVITLGCCSAAYVSAIMKSGFEAIPVGQWEAARVLGYSSLQAIWYIILPQVYRVIMPALCGEIDQVVKSTSLLSTIGIFELARAGRNIAEREMSPLPIYITVAFFYLAISLVFNGILQFWMQKRRRLP
jgi:polar amino acid transport system permease protein